MKTRYKYIEFQQDEKTKEWNCNNIKGGDWLGMVWYYKEWKQWVFCDINDDAIFSTDCLLDIADFLKQLNGAKP